VGGHIHRRTVDGDSMHSQSRQASRRFILAGAIDRLGNSIDSPRALAPLNDPSEQALSTPVASPLANSGG
jgi:hypothetical protein